MYYRVLLKDDYYQGNYKKYEDEESAGKSGYGDKTVTKLPPYADIQMAMSCKLVNDEWLYDNEKYIQYLKEEAEREAAQKEAAKVPTNAELMKALNDVMDVMIALQEEIEVKIEPLDKLAELLAK